MAFRSRSQLATENLFLRKPLALYAERRVRARRADDATRMTLVLLARLIDWRGVLTIVKPDTLIRWHRKGFRPGRGLPSDRSLERDGASHGCVDDPAVPRDCTGRSAATISDSRPRQHLCGRR